MPIKLNSQGPFVDCTLIAHLILTTSQVWNIILQRYIWSSNHQISILTFSLAICWLKQMNNKVRVARISSLFD